MSHEKRAPTATPKTIDPTLSAEEEEAIFEQIAECYNQCDGITSGMLHFVMMTYSESGHEEALSLLSEMEQEHAKKESAKMSGVAHAQAESSARY